MPLPLAAIGLVKGLWDNKGLVVVGALGVGLAFCYWRWQAAVEDAEDMGRRMAQVGLIAHQNYDEAIRVQAAAKKSLAAAAKEKAESDRRNGRLMDVIGRISNAPITNGCGPSVDDAIDSSLREPSGPPAADAQAGVPGDPAAVPGVR